LQDVHDYSTPPGPSQEKNGKNRIFHKSFLRICREISDSPNFLRKIFYDGGKRWKKFFMQAKLMAKIGKLQMSTVGGQMFALMYASGEHESFYFVTFRKNQNFRAFGEKNS
jgi:hypothetical protein